MARKNAQAEDLSNVEFETSEDVEVIPTFNAMNLKEELLRGIYAYGESWCVYPFADLKISQISKFPRLRETLGHSAEEHQTHCQGTRCDCPGAIGYR